MSESEEYLRGVCVALEVINRHNDALLWNEVLRAAGRNSMIEYALYVEPDEWINSGFNRMLDVTFNDGKKVIE